MTGVPTPGEVEVWLMEWQVAEDHLQFTLGEAVDWELVPADDEWMTQLFGERRTVPLQLDTYAAATRTPDSADWTRLHSIIQNIEQVSVTSIDPNDPSRPGPVPEHGAAVALSVPAIWPKQPHTGSVVGWIVRIRAA